MVQFSVLISKMSLTLLLLWTLYWDVVVFFTESPSKQRRQDAVGADGDEVKDIEMDKQESDEEMEKMEDQETKSVEESKHVQNLNVPKTIKGKHFFFYRKFSYDSSMLNVVYF